MTDQSPAARLAALTAEWCANPLLFVMSAFPWSVKGGPLEHFKGPRQWQMDVLRDIGRHLQNGLTAHQAFRLAVASGHGIGKSALVSWLILWAISTMRDTRGVVTAYKADQLKDKTWAELAKWHRMCATKDLFTLAATAIYSADPAHERTWRIDAVPWSRENPEGFAGLHNAGRRVFICFDEASGIDDVIWDTAAGAMSDSDTQLIWCVFGNPIRNQGRFRECFGSSGSRWNHRQIDSRTVDGTNKEEIAAAVAEYGEDSDRVRTRWRGIFPRMAEEQFISSEIVTAAQKVDPEPTIFDPVILGVDVARGGQDESVIAIRRGRDAKTEKWHSYHGSDLMQFAARVVQIATDLEADMTFIDEGGVGGGVLDRCKQLQLKCMGVNNGLPAECGRSDELCKNVGSLCWSRMRTWLKTGGAIPNDKDLSNQLETRQFDYTDRQEIRLEKKGDMKERGLGSPDRADALALTFAHPVPPRGRYEDLFNQDRKKFDPLASVRSKKFDPLQRSGGR